MVHDKYVYTFNAIMKDVVKPTNPLPELPKSPLPLLMKLGDISELTGLSKHLTKKLLDECNIQPVIVASSKFYPTDAVMAELTKKVAEMAVE